MSESVSSQGTASRGKTARVAIFDPPMCCSTGICGPSVDQALIDVNEMISTLQAGGIGVERYQMRTDPQAFLKNPEIIRLIREQQMAALPIVVVDGRVIKVGSYPTMAELGEALKGI